MIAAALNMALLFRLSSGMHLLPPTKVVSDKQGVAVKLFRILPSPEARGRKDATNHSPEVAAGTTR